MPSTRRRTLLAAALAAPLAALGVQKVVTAPAETAATAAKSAAGDVVDDQADCDAHGIDYQPCVLPGDVSERQRAHGDFMWPQFYNLVRVGAAGLYISMFDEYNEGNQIAKTTETAATTPAGFLALHEDGTACSSDYYLRLTNDGGKMLKGQIAVTDRRPTSPLVGADPGGGDDPARSVGLRAKANDLFGAAGASGLIAGAAPRARIDA